jgi:hypothetical protein
MGAGSSAGTQTAKVKCMGANSCKGLSSCKSAQHDCRGAKRVQRSGLCRDADRSGMYAERRDSGVQLTDPKWRAAGLVAS